MIASTLLDLIGESQCMWLLCQETSAMRHLLSDFEMPDLFPDDWSVPPCQEDLGLCSAGGSR